MARRRGDRAVPRPAEARTDRSASADAGCRAVSEARARRLTRLALVLLLLGCAAGVALPAGIGWDFANFYDTGRRVVAGQLADVYDASTTIAGAPPSTTLDFYGTPLSALLYAPLGLLPPYAALVVFKLVDTLALWGALLLLHRAGRGHVGDAPAAAARYAARFAWAALLFQPFWTVYRVGGQTTPLAFLLLTLGLLAHLRSRAGWAALCFAVAVAIKPAFALGYAFLLLAAGPRFLAFSLLHGAWLGALSIAVAGWPLHLEFLQKMAANSGRIAPWTYNSSIWIVPAEISRWIAGPGAESLAPPRWLVLGLQASIVAGCAALAWSTKRRPLPGAARVHQQWMIALIFFLLASQTAWEHYLAVLFLPVAFWLAAWDRAPRPVQRAVAAVVVLSVPQNLIFTTALAKVLPSESLPAILAVTLLKSAPTLIVLWLLVRHRAAWEATYQGMDWRPT